VIFFMERIKSNNIVLSRLLHLSKLLTMEGLLNVKRQGRVAIVHVVSLPDERVRNALREADGRLWLNNEERLAIDDRSEIHARLDL